MQTHYLPAPLVHIWLDLTARELPLLALFAAIGAGPVTLLHPRTSGAARLALAPAYGLAIALCVMMTVTWRVPADDCAWLLPLVAVGSLVIAWRVRPQSDELRGAKPGPLELAQILLVIVAIAYSFGNPLVARDSVGPVGQDVSDAAGYIATQDGLRTQSLHHAASAAGPALTSRQPDLTLAYWQDYATGYQEYGFDTVAAGADELLGLGGSQTFDPFLVVLLTVIALGAFAAVRELAGRRTWAAPLAGVLIGGPFWIQLFMDGSEGALSGLALLIPLALAGLAALRDGRRTDFVLLALLAAGLQTAYPLFVAPLAVAAALVLIGVGVRSHRAGTLDRRVVRYACLALLAILLLAIAFTPVAFARNVRYWHAVASGGLKSTYATLPIYYLPARLVPSWLLQTRWLYLLPARLTRDTVAASVLAPLVIALAVGYAVRRRPVLLAVLALIAVTALLADITWVDYRCAYCVDRNLLVDAPLLSTAFALGIGLLAAAGGLRLLAALVATAIAAIATYNQVHTGHLWIKQVAFAFDSQTRAVISHVPRLGPLQLALEGFSQTVGAASIENPTVYAAARYAAGSTPSIDPDSPDYGGFAYMTTPQFGPQLDPGYRYVLTRVDGVATARRTVFRDGPVALQQRVDRLDVLLVSGYGTTFARFDPSGTAWIQGPLHLLVAGGHPGEPVNVRLLAQVTGAATASGTTVSRHGPDLSVCTTVNGGLVRRLTVPFKVHLVKQNPPRGLTYGVPPPPHGLRLASVRATPGGCQAR
jgi:hypothetical protein